MKHAETTRNVTINPLGKDESGESELTARIDGVSGEASKTKPRRDSEGNDHRGPELEHEDGDMFLHSEDDTDY